ncbi:uncharacterized protein PAC_14566 [Phialocephala subalpina]|uniref:Uncharacterized protein n=1 Tax=Phialocephala subalpina TaxID=576137 RepID=A0A1L7XI29_9HELO|nr:uncharacterized protein PAC_14566 [Phialocephala subalpina]
MQELRRQIVVPESVTSPRDILKDDVRAEMIKRAGLDGVYGHLVNLKQREEYFAAIRTRIPENVEVAEFPPADLEYLCTLVSGITGPGLPYHREMKQFDFVSPIDEHQLEDMVEVVTVPIRNVEGDSNELTFIWEDWDIAVAFKIGGGPRSWGGSYALYCRHEENKEWKWRYGVHDEDWRSHVYDSVDHHKHFLMTCFTSFVSRTLSSYINSPNQLREKNAASSFPVCSTHTYDII